MNIQLQKVSTSSKERSLSELVEKFTTIGWFGLLGRRDIVAEKKILQFMRAIGVSDYTMEWITKERMLSVIENMTFEKSSVWEKLKDVPGQLKEEICRNEEEDLLESMTDTVLEAVFHSAFQGAYEQTKEKKVLNHLVGNAMYMSVLASGAMLAGKVNLYEAIIELAESGHTILGLEGDTLYIM